MDRRFLLILTAIILLFAGFIWFNRTPSETGNDDTDVEPTSHTVGEGTQGVTLVEYGDFQCNACAAFYPILKEVKEEYGDQITFQFRHFPLTAIHPNAMAAHRAAEAAAQQDAFWEMHDLLFERINMWNQANNAPQVMEDYATELGLNLEQFQADYASSTTNAVINADMAAGNDLGVTGTPTFILNGERIETPGPTLEDFKRVIDEAIENNQE